jgi:hypothetical protein
VDDIPPGLYKPIGFPPKSEKQVKIPTVSGASRRFSRRCDATVAGAARRPSHGFDGETDGYLMTRRTWSSSELKIRLTVLILTYTIYSLTS